MRPEDLLYEFEAIPDAPPGPAAAAAAAEPAVEPAPAPAGAEAVEPETIEEPEAEPTEEEMQEALREFIRDEWYALQASQGGASQGPIPGATPGPMVGGYQYGDPNAPFDWSQVDPYAEDFGQQIGTGIEQTIIRAMGAYMAPIAGSVAAQQAQAEAERGQELVSDMIEAELTSGPDLTDEAKPLVEPLAESLMPSIAQRYGNHPRAAEMAIREAATILRNIENAAATRGVTQHTNQIANLETAPPEPPPAGAQAAVPATAPAAPLDPRSLASKYGSGR